MYFKKEQKGQNLCKFIWKLNENILYEIVMAFARLKDL